MLKASYHTDTFFAKQQAGRFPQFCLFVCIVLFMLATGCATKSPPLPEEIQQQALADIELPTDWKAGGFPGTITDNWLTLFADDQLSALVTEAVTHNTDLRISAARVEQAAEYVNLAKAALLPAVNLFGTGGIKGGGGDMSSALQGVSLGVSWELDLWGRLRYGRNAAEETSLSAKADFEFARQSIAAATAKGWFTASETWLQKQIAEDMEQTAQLLLTLAEKRHKVGAGSEQDVALAQASLGTFRDNAAQIRLAHEQTLRGPGVTHWTLSSR